jgi:hypothetical protein
VDLRVLEEKIFKVLSNQVALEEKISKYEKGLGHVFFPDQE